MSNQKKDENGNPNTKDEEPNSQKKKGCCKKKKKESEPKEKNKKGCCKKEKKDSEPKDQKNKKNGCCQKKKKQPEKDDEEEQRQVDDGEPRVHVCNCCIYIRIGGRRNADTPSSSTTSKCCYCKCKWKQVICIITWIVVIISFILGLVFCIGYYEFVEVVLDQHDYRTWIMIACYIWFVFASSVFFLIVTKLQCATGCCLACKLIWFFVLHIPFGCITLALIYLTANPTREEAFNAHNLETTMNEEHHWLTYLQDQYECCFTTDDGTQFGNLHITQTCEKYVDQNSRKKKKVYDVEFNEIAAQRCDYLLYEIYDDTMTMGGVFTLVLLIIGVIPFVVYARVYAKRSKISPQDEEENEAEETSEGETKDDNTKESKKDEVEENNNKNETKGKEAKQKTQKQNNAKKTKEEPKKENNAKKTDKPAKKSGEKTKEPKKAEKKDQKRDKK